MKTEELKILIEKYFDRELEKNKEPVLFTMLSGNSEAREYFKSLNSLKTEIEETVEPFPEEIEKRILYSVAGKERLRNKGFVKIKLTSVLSYAAAVIFLIAGIFSFMELNNYKTKFEVISEEVTKQRKILELLYNSLPAAEIKADWENEIIIKANL